MNTKMVFARFLLLMYLWVGFFIWIEYLLHVEAPPPEHKFNDTRPDHAFYVSAGPLYSARFVWKPLRFSAPGLFPTAPHFQDSWSRASIEDVMERFSAMTPTGVDAAFWEPVPPCKLQVNGSRTYTAPEVAQFRKYIEQGYVIDLHVDGRPVVTYVGGGYTYGLPLGYISDDNIFLANHWSLSLFLTPYGEVAHVIGESVSTVPDASMCGRASIAPLRPGLPVHWTYRVGASVDSSARASTSDAWYDTIYPHVATNDIRAEVLLACSTVWVLIFLICVLVLMYRTLHGKFNIPGPVGAVASAAAGDLNTRETTPHVPTAAGEDTRQLLAVEAGEEAEDDVELIVLGNDAADAGVALTAAGTGSSVPISAVRAEMSRKHKKRFRTHTNNQAKEVLTYFRTVLLGRPQFHVLMAALVGLGVQYGVAGAMALVSSACLVPRRHASWPMIAAALMAGTSAIGGMAAGWFFDYFRGKPDEILALTVIVAIPTMTLSSVYMWNSYVDTTSAQTPSGQIFGLVELLSMIAINVLVQFGYWVQHCSAPRRGRSQAPQPLMLLSSEAHTPCCKRTGSICLSMAVSVLPLGLVGWYVTAVILPGIWERYPTSKFSLIVLLLAALWVTTSCLYTVLATYHKIVYRLALQWWWDSFYSAAAQVFVVYVAVSTSTYMSETFNDEETWLIAFGMITLVAIAIAVSLGALSVVANWVFLRHCVYREFRSE